MSNLRYTVIPQGGRHLGPDPCTSAGNDRRLHRPGAEDRPAKLPLMIADRRAPELHRLLLLVAFRSVAVMIKAAVMNLLSVAPRTAWSRWCCRAAGPDIWSASTPHAAARVRAGADVRGAVRTLDGLRGVPGQPDPGALARHRRRRRGGPGGPRPRTGARSPRQRPLDGGRVLQLRPDRRPVVKEFGIGLASAILLDATVVRCMLVPSVMQLLGAATGTCRGGSAASSRE